jgi:type VI secretion system protein ImpA
MMKVDIDLVGILTPIEGENPAGEDLRYILYDEIAEARREDDALERGDWQRETKSADWETVIELCANALVNRSKDLQIAAWLTEALTIKEGFKGLLSGLKVLRGFLENFWESVYPQIEEDDLEFRIGRLEFLNNSLGPRVKQIPMTDSSVRAGYSWLQWEESRKVGYEGDAAKTETRAELVAEGKLTAEEFDVAVAQSSRAFYETLAADVTKCKEEFQTLEELVDEKFGKEAPRLAELRKSLDDCDRQVSKILKEKRELEPDEVESADQEGTTTAEDSSSPELKPALTDLDTTNPIVTDIMPSGTLTDSEPHEQALWQKANEMLNASGIKAALQQLFVASNTAPSVRERNRYRLLMARLCLKADRTDLARPILEELHTLIEELNLERWESPNWIADVFEALYKCLKEGDGTEDPTRVDELFRKMCTLDVTKAMIYRNQT